MSTRRHLNCDAIVLLRVGAAILGLILLAGSLSGLELKTGQPFPLEPTAATIAEESMRLPILQTAALSFIQGVFGLLFLLLVVLLLINLLRRGIWKQVLLVVLGLVVLFGLLSLLPRIAPAPVPYLTTDVQENLTLPTSEIKTSPLGDTPPLLVWVVLAGILMLLAIAAWWLMRRKPTAQPDAILEEAQSALQALDRGENFQNVIIKCYLQMSSTLQSETGVAREANMTPREFEKALSRRGVPVKPVATLTRLFERVRYGEEPASPEEEEAGKSCLQAITSFYQEEAKL